MVKIHLKRDAEVKHDSALQRQNRAPAWINSIPQFTKILESYYAPSNDELIAKSFATKTHQFLIPRKQDKRNQKEPSHDRVAKNALFFN